MKLLGCRLKQSKFYYVSAQYVIRMWNSSPQDLGKHGSQSNEALMEEEDKTHLQLRNSVSCNLQEAE